MSIYLWIYNVVVRTIEVDVLENTAIYESKTIVRRLEKASHVAAVYKLNQLFPSLMSFHIVGREEEGEYKAVMSFFILVQVNGVII